MTEDQTASAEPPTLSNRTKAGSEAEQPPAPDTRRDMRIGYLIHDVSRLRRKAFDQLMRPIGVTRAQWWILAHLSRHDGMMQTELARVLDVGKASLGSLLDRLETAGLVERASDPRDRRIKRLMLTPQARALLGTMNAAEHDFNRQVLQGLSAEDRELLARLLREIGTRLSAIGQELPADGFSAAD